MWAFYIFIGTTPLYPARAVCYQFLLDSITVYRQAERRARAERARVVEEQSNDNNNNDAASQLVIDLGAVSVESSHSAASSVSPLVLLTPSRTRRFFDALFVSPFLIWLFRRFLTVVGKLKVVGLGLGWCVSV